MYAVMLRPASATGEATFIGSLGIVRLSEDGTAAEVGYGILPHFWGKGYAPEALKAFCNYYWNSESMSAFSDLDNHWKICNQADTS